MNAFIFCMRGNYNQKHTTRWSGYDAELIDMNVYTKHIFDHRLKKNIFLSRIQICVSPLFEIFVNLFNPAKAFTNI